MNNKFNMRKMMVERRYGKLENIPESARYETGKWIDDENTKTNPFYKPANYYGNEKLSQKIANHHQYVNRRKFLCSVGKVKCR